MPPRPTLTLPFIAALLFGLLLSACQPGPAPAPVVPTETPAIPTVLPTPLLQTEPTAAATSTGQVGVKPETLRNTHVHFWHAWGGAEAALLQSLVKEYNGTNPDGIWVDLTQLGNAAELDEKVRQAGQAGDPPDLAAAYLEQALGWGEEAAIADLTPYLTDPVYGWGQKELDDFWPGIRDGGLIDGRRVGLPAVVTQTLLFYNMTWARELGFSEAPTTVQGFREQACAAAKANLADSSRENDGLGGWIINPDPAVMESWIAGFGGSITPDGGTSYTFNTPQAEKAVEFLKGLFDQGCAWQARNPEPYGYFTGRGALLYAGTTQDIAKQAETSRAAGSPDEWTVIPFPGEAGAQPTLASGPYFLVLETQPKEQLAAWLFLRWLEAPERLAALAHAEGALPPRQSALEAFLGGMDARAQWAAAGGLLPEAYGGPYRPNWRTARFILQDAATQLFQSNTMPEQVGPLLATLDQTIQEVLQHQP